MRGYGIGKNPISLRYVRNWIGRYGVASGTDTYVLTLNPNLESYKEGQVIEVKFTNANTGPSTININGLGAKAIVKDASTPLASGDISAGQIFLLCYDGTNFQLTGSGGGGGGYLPPIARYVYLVNDASDQTRMGGTANNVYTTAQEAYDAAVVIQTALGGSNKVVVVVGDTVAATVGGIVLTANWNANVYISGNGNDLSLLNGITGDNNAGNGFTITTRINNCNVGNISTSATGATGNGGNINIQGNGQVGSITTISTTSGNGGSATCAGITTGTINTSGANTGNSGIISIIRAVFTSITANGGSNGGNCSNISVVSSYGTSITCQHYGSGNSGQLVINQTYLTSTITRSCLGTGSLAIQTLIRNSVMTGLEFISNGNANMFANVIHEVSNCSINTFKMTLNGSGSVSTLNNFIIINQCNLRVVTNTNTNTGGAISNAVKYNETSIGALTSTNTDTLSSTFSANNCAIGSLNLLAINSALSVAVPDIIIMKGGSLDDMTLNDPNFIWTGSNFDNVAVANDMRTETADYTANLLDNCIMCDATAGVINVQILGAQKCKNKKYFFKKTDASTNEIVITAGGVNIDQAPIYVIATIDSCVGIISDGTTWKVMEEIIVPYVNTTAVGNVGAGEDDLMVYTMPANILNVDAEYVSVQAFGDYAANANTKIIKMFFGATEMGTSGAVSLNGVGWSMQGTIIRTGASTQLANYSKIDANSSRITNTTPAEDLTTPIIIKCTGEGVADNDIVQRGMIIKVYKQ